MLLTETSSSGSRQGVQPPRWLVVFGANTGGPQALLEVLPQFPPHFPGSVIVLQQMRSGFTRVLVEQLSQVCRLPVCEPEDGHALHSGRILVAPSDTRLRIDKVDSPVAVGYGVLLEDTGHTPDLRHTRIDAAMTSVGEMFGTYSIGVLLTGLGSDGREGMRAIRDAGGITIAQDEASSVVHAMPAAAIDAGVVHEVLPLWSIVDRILGIVEGQADAIAA